MPNSAPISDVRHQAAPIFQVEWLTVEDHVSTTVTTTGAWLEKPVDHMGRFWATCIKVQALAQNIRYTIDTNPASPTKGFQLSAGSEVLIPVPNHGLSIAAEEGAATIEYQWVR